MGDTLSRRPLKMAEEEMRNFRLATSSGLSWEQTDVDTLSETGGQLAHGWSGDDHPFHWWISTAVSTEVGVLAKRLFSSTAVAAPGAFKSGLGSKDDRVQSELLLCTLMLASLLDARFLSFAADPVQLVSAIGSASTPITNILGAT